MTRVHFVRHGETVWHHDNRYAGSSDVALTDLGVLQGELLGRWAATQNIERVISSDLERARRTASFAADALGVTVQIDPRLREVHFGEGEGLTSSEMMERFPEERAAFVAAPASHPLPGGESGADAVDRAGQALIELTESGGSVLVVAHTTLGRLLLCHILGLQLDGYRRAFPSVGNGTVTTFDLPRNVATVDDLAGCAALIRFNSEIH